MDGRFVAVNPWRSPQWRYERAMTLLEARQRPRWFDDRPIRICWLFLHDSIDAKGDASKLETASRLYPQAAAVHSLRYSPESERRQILEARLLTSETFEQIAERTGLEPSTVEHYEQVCFNVR